MNQSAQNTLWSTGAAYLGFVSGTDAIHNLYLPGADFGRNAAGYANNFAWGALDIAAGNSLDLLDGNGTAGGALYVGEILGVFRFRDTNGMWWANNITGNGLNIYYDPGLAGNSYLGDCKTRWPAAARCPPSPSPVPSSCSAAGCSA